MKHSRKLLLASGVVASVSLLLVLAYQPLSLTKATNTNLVAATPMSSHTFTSATLMDFPTTSTAFPDSAIANIQSLIASNALNPMPTFNVYHSSSESSGSYIAHTVQGCALASNGWSVLYGASTTGLGHYFRVQKDKLTTAPAFISLGFFLGVHGIRKITFQTTSLDMMTSAQGERSIAVCLANLDGTINYNLPYKGNYSCLDLVYTTNMSTQFTFTMPDGEATDWTPRWLYIAGSFLTHNLATDYNTSTEEDQQTYYCDLVDFTVYFDPVC